MQGNSKFLAVWWNLARALLKLIEVSMFTCVVRYCEQSHQYTWQARTSRGLQVARKPPFRQKKKKRSLRFDRGQPSGRCEALRRKHFTLPNNVSRGKKLAESTLGAWNWGVELGRGTAVPTVPTQTVSSSVVADRSVYSKPRLSVFVRSWTSQWRPRCPGNGQQPNRPSLSRLLKLQSGAQPCEKMTSQTVVVVVDDDPSSGITEVGWLSQMLENAFLLL